MAGVHPHPGLMVVIGGAMIALALARHQATSLLVVGGAVVLIGLARLVGTATGGRADDGAEGRRRQ